MKFAGRYRNPIARPITGWLPAFLLAAFSLVPASAPAQTQSPKFVSFAEFKASLSSARSETFIRRADAKVGSATEFAKMRAYLVRMYGGATSAHGFLLDNQTFDCIPLMQQPSVRLLGLHEIASPPPDDAAADDAKPDINPGTDAVGNVQQCAEGTIPMRRITLEELSRYPTLAQFFRKYPAEVPQMVPGSQGNATSTSSHRWAHAYDNFVLSFGGEAVHNVWTPTIHTGASEVFSLSQQWYSGRLVGGNAPLQTAEIGWQNYPGKWGGQKAVVFIYWTRDDYKNTGCYNLDCPGFVQTSSTQTLGAALKPVSVQGGVQQEEFFGYNFYQGNWWALVGPNKKQSHYIGYYPKSIYQGGQMAYYADTIDIGGETVGTTKWPGMGSGQWAYKGFKHAAYERNILYRDSNYQLQAPQLTTSVSGANASNCYAITTPKYASNWLTYFYFGGPGGTTC